MTTRSDTLVRELLLYLIHDARKKLARKKNSTQYTNTADSFFAAMEQSIIRETQWSFPRVHEWYVRCHEAYGLLGGALTADHWQSPSFAESGVSEAGDEERVIKANVNDYKRDMHTFGRTLENNYATQFAKKQLFGAPVTLAASSGMAAITMALIAAKIQKGQDVTIAVGEHCYFENKELVHMLFKKERIMMFDERNPLILRTRAPGVLLIDAVANDPALTVPNIRAMYKELSTMPHPPMLVIDTSVCGIADVPIPGPLTQPRSLMLVESLNKYHQFGLDRVTGGIITAYGIRYDDLYTIRDHAGLNISEQSAATIPTPDASLLKRYIHRLRQNAQLYKEALKKIDGISVKTADQNGKTIGSIVSVELGDKKSSTYRKIIQRAMSLARKNAVPLLAGTTFGTPVTRLYTWSTRSEFERPFLRISSGLEDTDAATRVATVLGEAIRSVQS